MITANETTENLKKFVEEQDIIAENFFKKVFTEKLLNEISEELDLWSKDGKNKYWKMIECNLSEFNQINFNYFTRKIQRYFHGFGYEYIHINWLKTNRLTLNVIFNLPIEYLSLD